MSIIVCFEINEIERKSWVNNNNNNNNKPLLIV
jgi:hypothetical protein